MEILSILIAVKFNNRKVGDMPIHVIHNFKLRGHNSVKLQLIRLECINKGCESLKVCLFVTNC